MLKRITKYQIHLILLILGAIVFVRGIYFLDPDFGWHLREGGLILGSGIQRTDPFSYTMPSYLFIDHEWLNNIFMYLIYTHLGQYILSLVFAIIYVLSLAFAIPRKYRNYAPLPLILGGVMMIGFSGVRTQVVSWFFLALLLKFILDEDLWKKYGYFMPLIFLPWANLHGGFAIGIFVLSVFFLAKSLQERKIALKELAVFLLSLAVTFINPYGPMLWHEVWMQLSDTSLRWNIQEWSPAVFNFDLVFCILLVLSFFFIFVYRRKLKLYEIALYLFLLLSALGSVRMIPLWALCAIPLTAKAFSFFGSQIRSHKESVLRLEKVKKILIVSISLALLFEVSSDLLNIYNLDRYPVRAVEFLNKQTIRGNLLADYDVGGYLIWKLPTKKVFIDGRMPSWRRQGNYPNESNYAFKDYLRLLTDEGFLRLELKKYDITYILFPVPTRQKQTFLDNELQKIFPSGNQSIIPDILPKLGMIRIYDDGKYVIYRKKGLF